MSTSKSATRVERGDWQTPLPLAREVMRLVIARGFTPCSVLEPTCGTGAFLLAAVEAAPRCLAVGFDIEPSHVAAARAQIAGPRIRIETHDFFAIRWESVLQELPDPILVLGNPPWVTSADLGALGSSNLPTKTNFKRLSGFDAITGKGNFDVSEWMILRLLASLKERRSYCLAMLCKASVARRIMEYAARERWPITGSTYRIDAKLHFDAAVDAVLMIVAPATASAQEGMRWAVYDRLEAIVPSRHMGVVDGQVYSDIAGFERTRHLEGECAPEWRSGMKHDCARVMELSLHDGGLTNGLGERVSLEAEFLFPLLKGSDIANGRSVSERFVIVPQKSLGDDTRVVRERAPRTWQYLVRHRALLDARKSSIYRGQPPFAVFGIGEYAFAPYKVAICGLYKRLAFTLVEPVDGRPVMLDDTCYFLPAASREEGQRIMDALHSESARAFFEARVFWDEKRPIGKALLQSLSLQDMLDERGGGRRIQRRKRARQQAFAF